MSKGRPIEDSEGKYADGERRYHIRLDRAYPDTPQGWRDREAAILEVVERNRLVVV